MQKHTITYSVQHNSCTVPAQCGYPSILPNAKCKKIRVFSTCTEENLGCNLGHHLNCKGCKQKDHALPSGIFWMHWNVMQEYISTINESTTTARTHTNPVYCSCLLLVGLNNEINQIGCHGINSVPQISLIINGGKIKRYLASNEGILLTESPNYLRINPYKIVSNKVKLFLLLYI